MKIKDDDSNWEEETPWGFGSIGPISDEPCKPNKKQMPYIGFYENKEKSDALHEERKTRLQTRVRRVSQQTGTKRKSK